ncbi:hypothetical protein [Vibrio phage vB_VhaP_PG11]|nr:hypothetical protein [Vibrio phage vB_VhaP_PG11]
MRYRCTEWLEGFTVGSVYWFAWNPKHRAYQTTNDEAEPTYLSHSQIVIYFEEA